jgi:hypothetical protein
MVTDFLQGKSFKATWRRITSDYSHWLSFVVLMIVAMVVNPGFLAWNNLSNQFIQGAIVGICAMGMSLVISAGMIDLTVGSACAFISGMGVQVLNATGSGWLCLLFCLGAGFIIGLINGVLVTKGKIPYHCCQRRRSQKPRVAVKSLYRPAVIGFFKTAEWQHQDAAVFGTHRDPSRRNINFGNFPGGAVVEEPGSLLGDKPPLFAVKAVFIGQAAQEPSAGAGNFH